MDHNLANAINSDAAHWRMKWDRSLRWAMGPPGGGRCFSSDGMLILRRWSGRKYPIPDDAPGVGFLLRPATTISSDQSGTFANDTTYHFMIDKVSPAGMLAPRNPLAIRTAAWGPSGYVGLMPNAPCHVSVAQDAAAKAVVTWRYSSIGESAGPASFDVFENDTPTTMDLATPVANIPYVRGRAAYSWTSGVHADGVLKYYTVRAKTAALVYSLIPRSGPASDGEPLPTFGSMVVADAARVSIVANALAKPPAPRFA